MSLLKKTVYHGSTSFFKRFSHKTKGSRTNHRAEDVGFHFTDNLEEAEMYSNVSEMDTMYLYKLAFGGKYPEHFQEFFPTVYHVKLDIKNPLRFYNEKIKIDESVIKNAIKSGYDSLIYQIDAKGYKKTEYVVFKVNQISIVKTVFVFDKKKVEKKWKDMGSPTFT